MSHRHCPCCRETSAAYFLANAGFTVVRCPACGLRYVDPLPEASDLTELYGESYFTHEGTNLPGYDRYLNEIENHRRTFDDRLPLLPSPGSNSRLLDVGAATGVFVERARLYGWNAEGVEPSKWAAGYARETLGQPVQHATLESASFEPDTFHVVTLWEVIEHLPDPRETLQEIHRILITGGHLALSTPDSRSLVSSMLGRRWPGWRKLPEHLTFFDRSTLTRLLIDSGFRVLAMRYVPLTVSRRYLIDRMREILGMRAMGPSRGRWLERSIRVNPGFDLFVLARAE